MAQRKTFSRWHYDQKDFILENWEHMTDAEMAAKLGKSRRAVEMMRHQLGRKKKEGWIPDRSKAPVPLQSDEDKKKSVIGQDIVSQTDIPKSQ